MGNQSEKGPKTNKISSDGANHFINYGKCEMQGWRNNMVNYILKD